MSLPMHRRIARGGFHAGLAASLVAGMLAVPPPSAQAAALYRWTDADGVVQFADSPPLEPPPGGLVGPGLKTVGEAMAEEAEQARIARREALLRAEEAAARERERAARAEAMAAEMSRKTIISPYGCEEARQILAAQRRPRRVYYTLGEGGRFQPISAEEARRNIAEWEKAVEELCADNVRIVAPGSEEAEQALAEQARLEAQAAAAQGEATQP